MTESKHNWLVGNLPMWVAVGLLGILAWGGKQYVGHINSTLERHTEAIDNVSKLLAEREPRFTALEEQARFTREIIAELKQGQKDVIAELRVMNAKLQQQRR